PLIVLNFKTYSESSGSNALRLAKHIEKVSSKRYEIVVAPSLLTMKEIAEKTSLNVYSQHADNTGLGAHTGSIPVEELKLIKVKGTLLNHSERKMPFEALSETVKLCRKYSLKTIICASSLSELAKIAKLQPDHLAYEPPELIGGNISVTNAHPEVLLKASKLLKKISPKTMLLCGAGVHSKEDLHKALELGAKGVLIAHAVVKAKNPERFLKKMLS
ncbi:MAG: triose-phosphate isomerase, partial [Nanoarchaeota archaeon]